MHQYLSCFNENQTADPDLTYRHGVAAMKLFLLKMYHFLPIENDKANLVHIY